MADLYDLFSPVALRERTVWVEGPPGSLAECIERTFQAVGARLLPERPPTSPDVHVVTDGSGYVAVAAAGRSNRIVFSPGDAGRDPGSAAPEPPRQGWPVRSGVSLDEEVARTALFLACPASGCLDGVRIRVGQPPYGVGAVPRDLEGLLGPGSAPGRTGGASRPAPLGLYDTFSPTVLRGRVALVDGTGDSMTAGLVLELARAGASVAVCAPAGPAVDTVVRETRAMGRDVRRFDPGEAQGAAGERSYREPGGRARNAAARGVVGLAVAAYGRLDIVVNTPAPARGAYIARAAAPFLAGGAMVNLVPAAAWPASGDLDSLDSVLQAESARANARVYALGLPAEEVAAQRLGWVAVFLASRAARAVAPQCLPLSGC